MAMPPPYIPLSASTATTPTTSTEKPFEPQYFIPFALLSMVAWLIIGVLAFSNAVNSGNEQGMAFLAVLLIFTMIISTPIACAYAPHRWVCNVAYTGTSIVVVSGLTITCMLLGPGCSNPFEGMFIILGSLYGGILLEAFTGMSRRFCQLFESSQRKEEYNLSTAV